MRLNRPYTTTTSIFVKDIHGDIILHRTMVVSFEKRYEAKSFAADYVNTHIVLVGRMLDIDQLVKVTATVDDNGLEHYSVSRTEYYSDSSPDAI